MLNGLDKKNFQTRIGRELALGLGHTFDEKRPACNQDTTESATLEVYASQDQYASQSAPLQPLSVNEAEVHPGVRSVVSPVSSLKNTLSLHDIVRYFKNNNVVGEENLVACITLAAINGSSFGVEGYSGSGKTFIVDKLVELLSDVYTIQQSSNLAIFNDVERINSSRFIYVRELQKAMKDRKAPIIEVIKDLTEGKDSNRIVTRKDGNGITEYTIKSGVSIIYTLAVENDFKKDDESSRRLIRFSTDSSKEHLEEIHQYKAKERYSLNGSHLENISLENRLKQHITDCMSLSDYHILDPFSTYMSDFFPRTQKSVGYIDHYYSLLDGSAKFHFNQRQKFALNGDKYLILDLEDHVNVYNIYYKEFVDSLKGLAKEGERIDGAIKEPDWRQCFESGVRILAQDEALNPLRDKNPNLVKDWCERQINEDYNVNTIDHKRGEERTIVNLG